MTKNKKDNKENIFFAGVKSYFKELWADDYGLVLIAVGGLAVGGLAVGGLAVAIFSAAVGANAVDGAFSKKKSKKYIAGIITAAVLTTGALGLGAIESFNYAKNHNLNKKSVITTSFNNIAKQNQVFKTSSPHVLKAPAIVSKFK